GVETGAAFCIPELHRPVKTATCCYLTVGRHCNAADCAGVALQDRQWSRNVSDVGSFMLSLTKSPQPHPRISPRPANEPTSGRDRHALHPSAVLGPDRHPVPCHGFPAPYRPILP